MPGEQIIIKLDGSEDLLELGYDVSGSDFDLFVYDYHTGDYEGWGDAIILKNGKWYWLNMGHCSCYDAMEDWPGDDVGDSIIDYYNRCTPAQKETLKPHYDVLMKFCNGDPKKWEQMKNRK